MVKGNRKHLQAKYKIKSWIVQILKCFMTFIPLLQKRPQAKKYNYNMKTSELNYCLLLFMALNTGIIYLPNSLIKNSHFTTFVFLIRWFNFHDSPRKYTWFFQNGSVLTLLKKSMCIEPWVQSVDKKIFIFQLCLKRQQISF